MCVYMPVCVCVHPCVCFCIRSMYVYTPVYMCVYTLCVCIHITTPPISNHSTWKLVTPFLDPVSREKVHFVYSSDKSAQKLFEEFDRCVGSDWG